MPLETPLRELHEQAGATLGTYFEAALPEVFSGAAAEYRAARDAVALVDTNFRAFFYFSGTDRARYLNAMLTNDVRDLAVGQGVVSLLLNPQGHILAEIETYALPDRILGVSHAAVRERTAETLEKYIIMDDVTLEDTTEQLGSLALEGPQAAALLRELAGIELEAMARYAHTEASVAGVRCRIVRRSLFGQLGAELVASRSQLPALWEALAAWVGARGGAPVGYRVLNALRLEAGIPWYGYDFDENQIPHEAGLESSHISYSKGCYTGQEIVERVRSRGHVNRRRVGLQFAGHKPPERGVKLAAAGQEAGYVTSAAFSPALAHAIGMGYVWREYLTPGSKLDCAGTEAEVIELPLTASAAHSQSES